MIKRQIVFDGRKNKVTGREIISLINGNFKPISKETFFGLFCRNDPILDSCKEKVEEETVHIFYPYRLFPTPYGDGKDMSVYYFCWNSISQEWYSTYWRVEDTWNVIVAILIDD